MIRIRRVFLFVLLSLAGASFLSERLVAGQGMLQVYFLDVGQGDSIYIRTPGGRDMLVDAGLGASVLPRLAAVMPWNDRSIDVVVETHPDADHIGGLPDVLGRYEVGMFIEPGVESDNSIDDQLRMLIKKKNTPAILARRGMRVNFGDGAVFDILFPGADVSNESDTNAASIVGRMRYGSTSIMLTGDSPKAVEDRLVRADGARLRSDVLKAGHHGSRTSSGEGYVRAVNPRYAVISAGKANRYGHPHIDVVEIFNRLGIDMLRTDEEGTIGFVSDGTAVSRK